MANNIFGIILAGGQGTRMGNAERPKQFMEIGKKDRKSTRLNSSHCG